MRLTDEELASLRELRKRLDPDRLNQAAMNGLDKLLAFAEHLGPLDHPPRFHVAVDGMTRNMRDEAEKAITALEKAEIEPGGYGSNPWDRGVFHSVEHFGHHFLQARTAWNEGNLEPVSQFFDVYVGIDTPMSQAFFDRYTDEGELTDPQAELDRFIEESYGEP